MRTTTQRASDRGSGWFFWLGEAVGGLPAPCLPSVDPGSPVDLVSGAEALLVPLRSLRELQGLVEGSFIRQQPSQGARGVAPLPGGG